MEICVSCMRCGAIRFIKFIRPEQYTTFLCENCKPEEVGECEVSQVYIDAWGGEND